MSRRVATGLAVGFGLMLLAFGVLLGGIIERAIQQSQHAEVEVSLPGDYTHAIIWTRYAYCHARLKSALDEVGQCDRAHADLVNVLHKARSSEAQRSN
jgi:hypothetical protein